jgi:hypothetical protein
MSNQQSVDRLYARRISHAIGQKYQARFFHQIEDEQLQGQIFVRASMLKTEKHLPPL